ncbi:hypothetical protein [Serratia symbiotica]|uniref:Uncharacterized protein n=1 Tax=Serratia symbiotica TaxID=138074 RepID=A0A068Z825_9GAMM|nr:hypothetical protein [Serratia symbiotica]QLH63070.1 hypothetical protein SYMBAF_09230 [Serratia symbiotica]CDS57279.1 hypothetical protein SYMBAF_20131 [Serratia symbiotica]
MNKEISKRDYYASGLLASGFTQVEVAALTQFLDAPADSLSFQDELIHSKQLKIAEALSIYGIVSHLRRLAESPDHKAAVAAVGLLVQLSQHTGMLDILTHPNRIHTARTNIHGG